jgi:hypothetical protein
MQASAEQEFGQTVGGGNPIHWCGLSVISAAPVQNVFLAATSAIARRSCNNHHIEFQLQGFRSKYWQCCSLHQAIMTIFQDFSQVNPKPAVLTETRWDIC